MLSAPAAGVKSITPRTRRDTFNERRWDSPQRWLPPESKRNDYGWVTQQPMSRQPRVVLKAMRQNHAGCTCSRFCYGALL